MILSKSSYHCSEIYHLVAKTTRLKSPIPYILIYTTHYSKKIHATSLTSSAFVESTKSSSIFSKLTTQVSIHDFHPDVGLIVFDMDLDSKLHTSNLSFDLFTNDGQTKTRLPDLPDLSPSADYFSACMVIVNRTTVFYAGENSARSRVSSTS